MGDKILDFLNKLVSIDSHYPEEKNLCMHLNHLLEDHGFIQKQRVENNRFNLVVEKGKGKKSVLLYSHLDTIGVANGWKTKPFKLTVVGNKAYGLGSWDMKGGMAVNILNFLNFQPKNFTLKIAFCVDEENISKGGYRLINSNFMKGVECVVSPEPAFYYKNRGIVIARPGRAVYVIKIKGLPLHYALYHPALDINLFLSDFLNELKRLNKFSNKKNGFIFARRIESKTTGMSTPHEISLELDSSILPPKTNKQLLEEIKNLAKIIKRKYGNYFSVNVSFLKRDTPFLNSYEISKNNKYLKMLKQSVSEKIGKKALPYFRTSISDENIFGVHGITVLGIGPNGGNAHAPNEWVSLSSLEKLYIIINDFLNKVDNQV